MHRSKRPRLLDDLVGGGEQLWWHGDAEHPGGQEIDDHSNLVDCTTGNSAGFAPLRTRPV